MSPADYLAGFLPRFLGIERFSQVLHLLPVYFGEVGVQLDGWWRLCREFLLDPPLVAFEPLELSLQGV